MFIGTCERDILLESTLPYRGFLLRCQGRQQLLPGGLETPGEVPEVRFRQLPRFGSLQEVRSHVRRSSAEGSLIPVPLDLFRPHGYPAAF